MPATPSPLNYCHGKDIKHAYPFQITKNRERERETERETERERKDTYKETKRDK